MTRTMLRRFLLLFCLILPLSAAGQEGPAGAAADEGFDGGLLRLATWNIRILSDGSRDDAELAYIAQIMERYDLVAVQELRDTRAAQRLLAMLSGWEAVVSEPAGRGVKERCAFFYRTAMVEPLGDAFLLPDPADLFIREPYIGGFRAGNFDFTLITIHLLYGSGKNERRRELVLLDDVVRAVDFLDGAEEDQILLGDFNFDADDPGWQCTRMVPVVAPEVKTTITDTSSYDNVWIDPERSREYAGFLEVYRFDELLFADDDRAASLAVSDHRPVAVLMATGLPDDDGEDPGAGDGE
jgi:endonuclease/exonuclease/phosphatase family metal-dependent hydrolase